jgi:hypothetical protein
LREVVYGLTVVLLLAAVLTAFNVKPVEALWTGGTIYIRADGSIDPPDAPITTSDNITYRLTDDIQITSGDGIVIERDNIILNGSGHSITGSGGGIGVFLSGRVNITITAFDIGIWLEYSNNNTLLGNSIANSHGGICL